MGGIVVNFSTEYNQLIEFSQVERLFTMCAAYNEVVMELEKILYYVSFLLCYT